MKSKCIKNNIKRVDRVSMILLFFEEKNIDARSNLWIIYSYICNKHSFALREEVAYA